MPAHGLNSDRQAIIDKATEPWGVKIEVVEGQGRGGPRIGAADHGQRL